MSADARNSIYLWVGGVAVFAVFWAISHFDLLGLVPEKWLWPTLAVIIAINLLQSIWLWWRRHSKHTGNING